MKTNKAKTSVRFKARPSRSMVATEPIDLDHCDALVALRDRLVGLRCAIYGASISDDLDRNALHRFASDVAENVEMIRKTFSAERGLKP